MNTPLVSVIIPNYNHAQYLEKRIDTVLNQTYQNIEVIILDDKSTDNSLEVIEKYRNHPKVAQIVVNEQNTGSPFKQWDKGINLAKGELIWIAESDDYNELTFLEELITEWGKHKDVVVAFSNYVQFWEDDFLYPKERKSQCFNGICFIKNRMARGCVIVNASGTIFRKNVYSNIRKDFIEYQSAGDYLFWTYLLAHGNVLKVNKNLTYFRKITGSVTSSKEKQGITALEDKKILEYIDATYHLNHFQRSFAFAQKLMQFSLFKYDNEEIRKTIYERWDEPYHAWRPSRFFLWLSGSLERHFGILI